MRVLIPIRCTENLDANVEKSIKAQTVNVIIELFQNTPVSTCKRKGEFEGRDAIVLRAKEIDDEYVVSNESAGEHLYVDNFKCMQDKMQSDKKLGAVALWRFRGAFSKPCSEHVVGSCVMWRTKILAQMPVLNIPEIYASRACSCMRYKDAVEALGFKMCYLDDIRRVRERG
jgi:hypothetical protein